ncbi:hypothetical protein D3C73_1263100 [compost metagenome]
MFTQRRELTAKGQQENGDVHQADTGVDPVPFDATRQQVRGNHRENHARHAEEGICKQQARSTLATFIHLGDQESTNRHGDPADDPQHKHGGGEQRQAMREH